MGPERRVTQRVAGTAVIGIRERTALADLARALSRVEPRPLDDHSGGMVALLSKSQRVLDRMMTKNGLVQFSQPDMEPEMKTELVLREQDWIDFGSPAQVTITIFAGDLLNAEESG